MHFIGAVVSLDAFVLNTSQINVLVLGIKSAFWACLLVLQQLSWHSMSTFRCCLLATLHVRFNVVWCLFCSYFVDFFWFLLLHGLVLFVVVVAVITDSILMWCVWLRLCIWRWAFDNGRAHMSCCCFV